MPFGSSVYVAIHRTRHRALALHFGMAQNNKGSAAANCTGYCVTGCTGTTRYGLVVGGARGGDRGRFLPGDRRCGLDENPPATAPATAVDTLGTAPAAAGTAPATAVTVPGHENDKPSMRAVTWPAGCPCRHRGCRRLTWHWHHPITVAGKH